LDNINSPSAPNVKDVLRVDVDVDDIGGGGGGGDDTSSTPNNATGNCNDDGRGNVSSPSQKETIDQGVATAINNNEVNDAELKQTPSTDIVPYVASDDSSPKKTYSYDGWEEADDFKLLPNSDEDPLTSFQRRNHQPIESPHLPPLKTSGFTSTGVMNTPGGGSSSAGDGFLHDENQTPKNTDDFMDRYGPQRQSNYERTPLDDEMTKSTITGFHTNPSTSSSSTENENELPNANATAMKKGNTTLKESPLSPSGWNDNNADINTTGIPNDMPEMKSRSEKTMARRKRFNMSSDAQMEGGSDDPLANDSGSSKENITYDGSRSPTNRWNQSSEDDPLNQVTTPNDRTTTSSQSSGIGGSSSSSSHASRHVDSNLKTEMTDYESELKKFSDEIKGLVSTKADLLTETLAKSEDDDNGLNGEGKEGLFRFPSFSYDEDEDDTNKEGGEETQSNHRNEQESSEISDPMEDQTSRPSTSASTRRSKDAIARVQEQHKQRSRTLRSLSQSRSRTRSVNRREEMLSMDKRRAASPIVVTDVLSSSSESSDEVEPSANNKEYSSTYLQKSQEVPPVNQEYVDTEPSFNEVSRLNISKAHSPKEASLSPKEVEIRDERSPYSRYPTSTFRNRKSIILQGNEEPSESISGTTSTPSSTYLSSYTSQRKDKPLPSSYSRPYQSSTSRTSDTARNSSRDRRDRSIDPYSTTPSSYATPNDDSNEERQSPPRDRTSSDRSSSRIRRGRSRSRSRTRRVMVPMASKPEDTEKTSGGHTSYSSRQKSSSLLSSNHDGYRSRSSADSIARARRRQTLSPSPFGRVDGGGTSSMKRNQMQNIDDRSSRLNRSSGGQYSSSYYSNDGNTDTYSSTTKSNFLVSHLEKDNHSYTSSTKHSIRSDSRVLSRRRSEQKKTLSEYRRGRSASPYEHKPMERNRSSKAYDIMQRLKDQKMIAEEELAKSATVKYQQEQGHSMVQSSYY